MAREVPIDFESFEQLAGEDEDDDLFLSEGKHAYSWERFSESSNEGWGHDQPSHRRRRRRYEGDSV